jgi:RNA polymerase sigma-70 factor (ECF subfamily)
MTAQSPSLAHGDLLERARQGDPEALSSLVRLHHDRVYRYGRRVCLEADVDDAVQEAFVSLSRSIDRVQDPIGWLLQTVKHWCLRLLRPFARQRRALGEVEHEADLSSESDNPARALERWRLVEAVHRALGRLDLKYREVLVLRDLEGLSGPEVATALGLSEEAMKTRLHRARGQLRDLLREAGYGPATS